MSDSLVSLDYYLPRYGTLAVTLGPYTSRLWHALDDSHHRVRRTKARDIAHRHHGRHDNVGRACYPLVQEGDTMETRTRRTEKLDIRLTPAAKRTLYAAARAAQRSVSDFVLESALVRAEETLIDRRHFGLDTERWQAFMAALDAPPRELPRLQRLFSETSVFERETTP